MRSVISGLGCLSEVVVIGGYVLFALVTGLWWLLLIPVVVAAAAVAWAMASTKWSSV